MTAQDLLVEMFERMVIAKDASRIEHYYHPEFRMTANGHTQDYEEFAASHRRIYATPISYQVRYDDEAWVATADRVGGRVWITTSRPGEEPTELEVVLVATLLDGRLHRVWELSWPDWSALPAFETYETA